MERLNQRCYHAESKRVSAWRRLIRFVRLHFGDGNEDVGREEIDRSWAETVKILLRDQPVDRDFIAQVMDRDESTLALLFYHPHFYAIRRIGKADS